MFTEKANITIECDLNHPNLVYLDNVRIILKMNCIEKVVFRIDSEHVDEHIVYFLKKVIIENNYIDFYLPSHLRHFGFKAQYYVQLLIPTRQFSDLANQNDIIHLMLDICSEQSMPLFHKLLTETPNNIVLYFLCNGSQPLLLYRKALESMQELVHIRKFYLCSLFIRSDEIRKHPCNMHFCVNKTCDINNFNIPRYLYIHSKGISPYRTRREDLSFFKTIQRHSLPGGSINNLLNQYVKSAPYNILMLDAKTIFHQFVVNASIPYNLIAWNIFLDAQDKLLLRDKSNGCVEV